MVGTRKKRLKKRIPQLLYTELRGIGYHVNYRDPQTGKPRKHRFGKLSREAAVEAYHHWLAAHITGEKPTPAKPGPRKLVEQVAPPKQTAKPVTADIVDGCLLEVTTGMLRYDEQRIRADDAPRTKGTFKRKQFESKRDIAHDFLAFVNKRHGQGAVGRMRLADLTMEDVESYNLLLVQADYSDSRVKKHMQVVKNIIDRAGRPEHGRQTPPWNWESLDSLHGRPDKPVMIPTLRQLRLVLQNCDTKRTAMVWMAIGLGFGQSDLAAARVEHFDRETYDMRRSKTGLERYGEMPPLVCRSISKYLAETPRPKGELLFLTAKGMPLVHDGADSVAKWWGELRESLGDDGKGLNGFYSLRHLGATEYGSRPGCSLAAMRGWLGHAVSSAVADRYMKSPAPENKEVVDWVRAALQLKRGMPRLRTYPRTV